SRVLDDVAPQLRCQRLELLGRALLPFGAGTAPRTAHRTRGSTRGTPRRGRAAPQPRGFDGTPHLFGDRGSQVFDETIDNGTNGLIVHEAREAIMFAKAWSACFRLLSTGVRHSVRSRRGPVPCRAARRTGSRRPRPRQSPLPSPGKNTQSGPSGSAGQPHHERSLPRFIPRGGRGRSASADRFRIVPAAQAPLSHSPQPADALSL